MTQNKSSFTIQTLYEKLCKESETLHQRKQEELKSTGYLRHSIKEAGQIWVDVEYKYRGDPEWEGVIESGEYSMSLLLNNLQDVNRASSSNKAIFRLETSASAYSANSAVLSNTDIDLKPYIHVPGPHVAIPLKSKTANRLSTIDSTLKNVYMQIWDVQYVTADEGFRSALYQMRQTYDHLFAVLAPDDAVRNSEYWQKKSGDKPNQIHRIERLRYAAHTHIKNVKIAEEFANAAKTTLEIYGKLNQAHKRGQLSLDKVNATLNNMDEIIVRWLDAMENK